MLVRVCLHGVVVVGVGVDGTIGRTATQDPTRVGSCEQIEARPARFRLNGLKSGTNSRK